MLNSQFIIGCLRGDRNKNLQKSNANLMSVFTVFLCGILEDFCSHFGLSCMDLGVAGAPGVGVFPFSLYSNHLSGKGDPYNPKDDL